MSAIYAPPSSSTWKKATYPRGTSVHVFDLRRKYLGIGVLKVDFPNKMIIIEGPKKNLLFAGKDCFWIPVEEYESNKPRLPKGYQYDVRST